MLRNYLERPLSHQKDVCFPNPGSSNPFDTNRINFKGEYQIADLLNQLFTSQDSLTSGIMIQYESSIRII